MILANFVIACTWKRKSNFLQNLILFERNLLHIQYPIFFPSFCSSIALYKYLVHCQEQDTKTLAPTITLILTNFFSKLSKSCLKFQPLSAIKNHSIVFLR